jgi:hypothetical protein
LAQEVKVSWLQWRRTRWPQEPQESPKSPEVWASGFAPIFCEKIAQIRQETPRKGTQCLERSSSGTCTGRSKRLEETPRTPITQILPQEVAQIFAQEPQVLPTQKIEARQTEPEVDLRRCAAQIQKVFEAVT